MEVFRVVNNPPYNYKNINEEWNVSNSTNRLVHVLDNPEVNMRIANYDIEGSTWVLHDEVWTLDEYADHLVFVLTMFHINTVLDESVEQYLVYPEETAPNGWLGWCSKKVNGKIIPIECE